MIKLERRSQVIIIANFDNRSASNTFSASNQILAQGHFGSCQVLSP